MNSWIEFANGDLVCRDEYTRAIIRVKKMTYLVEEEMDMAEVVWDIEYIYDRWSYSVLVPIEDIDYRDIKAYAEWMYNHVGRIIPEALNMDDYR